MKRLLCLLLISFNFIAAMGQDVNPNSKIDDVTAQSVSIIDVVAYPNPFVTKTTITFQLDSETSQNIYFELKNVLGNTVSRKNIVAESGKNSIEVYRNNLPSGMYIYTLTSETEVTSKRLVVK